jgi:hypothetical protein
MQLMIGDLITCMDEIRDFETILQGLIDVTNSSEVYALLRIRCPQCLKTRGLFRSIATSQCHSRVVNYYSLSGKSTEGGTNFNTQVEQFHPIPVKRQF